MNAKNKAILTTAVIALAAIAAVERIPQLRKIVKGA